MRPQTLETIMGIPLSEQFQVTSERGHEAEQRLLTVKEAARYLAVSASTLYGCVWQRRIPFVKVGRALRFDPRDLEAFIESNKQHPQQESSHSVSRPTRCYNTRAAGKG